MLYALQFYSCVTVSCARYSNLFARSLLSARSLIVVTSRSILYKQIIYPFADERTVLYSFIYLAEPSQNRSMNGVLPTATDREKG